MDEPSGITSRIGIPAATTANNPKKPNALSVMIPRSRRLASANTLGLEFVILITRWITTAVTGPPENTLHWQTARPAAPCARHCSVLFLQWRSICDQSADHRSMPDAIHPAPAPIIPQNGPITKIIANAPSAPIPHAASFGPSEAM